MRFMFMVKSKELTGPPPQALMDAINKQTEDAVKKGTLVLAGGLAPVTQTQRVRITNGRINVTDGPFAEAKEVIGGFAIFDLASREEALKSAEAFMELHRIHWPGWEGETEIRQIFSEEDFEKMCGELAKQQAS
jgi:hypothetical protein